MIDFNKYFKIPDILTPKKKDTDIIAKAGVHNSPIVISDWKGVFSNANPERIKDEFLVECQNLKPEYGNLNKTFGIGALIATGYTNTGSYTTENLFTFIESHLTTPDDYMVFLVEYEDTVGTVKIVKWTGAAWSQVTTTNTYYHDETGGATVRNPIFQDHDILRILPGARGLVVTNEARGIWYGYINRKFFDENYAPTAAFYSYDTEVAKPDINWTCENITDTGISCFTSGVAYYYRFSAVYDGVQESLLSNEFVMFRPTAANQYPVLQSENLTKTAFNKRITAIKIYRSERVNDGYTLLHTIELQRLASDITDNTLGVLLGLSYAYVPILSNYWFDASVTYQLNIKSLDDSTYYKKAIVNPSTNSGTVGGGTGITGISSGAGGKALFDTVAAHGMTATNYVTIANCSEAVYDGTHYILAVTATSFTIDFAYTVGDAADDGDWYECINGEDTFQYNAATCAFNAWNTAWELLNAADTVLAEGTESCYTGNKSAIFNNTTLSKGEYSGGLFFLASKFGATTTAESAGGGYNTKFTSAAHGLTAGQHITLFGFTGASNYNGTYLIISADTNTFTLYLCAYNAGYDATGSWATSWEETKRILDDNSEKAIHFSDTLSTGAATASWLLLKPSTGMYIWYGGTTSVFCRFYDIFKTTIGTSPPLEGATINEVNGRFAKVIGDRLWQGYIVLDPGGKAESHPEWISYSELNQLDITPNSTSSNPGGNILRLRDVEGGVITGIFEVFGNPVFTKEQVIAQINYKRDPSNPNYWEVTRSIHNIGNIAPLGGIEVLGDLYVVYRDGIYRLRPNNLAETDTTPTETLRITEPIRDVFLALGDGKANIQAGYDPLKSEIVYKFSSTEVWAYNVITETWREIDTDTTISYMATDQNANLIVLNASTNKVYTFNASESVPFLVQTKTFSIDELIEKSVRYVVVTYKCSDPLLCRVYDPEENIASGYIQRDVDYYVKDYTTVVYNGTTYHNGDIFKGIDGDFKYTTTGSGTVKCIWQYELPENTYIDKYKIAPRFNTKKFTVELSSGIWGIIGVNATSETFTVRGDMRNFFPAAGTFQVVSSTGNDGNWTVTSSTYSDGTDLTTITVTGNITNATADGIIKITSSNAAQIGQIYIEHD